MKQITRNFLQSAIALAAASLLAACGGGSASAPALTAQAITFGAVADKVFSTATSALSATASSGLAVTLASLTPSYCTVSGSTLTIVAAGSCQVKATQAGNTTFAAATDVTNTFNITKAIQAITFTSPGGQTIGTAAPVLSATGGASGSAVTIASSTASVCTVSGTALTLVAAGNCTLTASQAGNTNYSAATDVVNTFAVAAAPVVSGNTGTCTAAPCIGFENANTSINNFGQALTADIVNDPVLATNKVIRLVKKPASPTWDGATVSTAGAANTVAAVGFATSKTITLRAYSPAAGKIIMLKVENSGNGAVFMEAQATTTKANGWETLTFNYASPSNGAFDAAAAYDRISIFPEFNSVPTADATYYFDELKYSASTVVPTSSLKFASTYSQVDAGNWKSTELGSASQYIDNSAGVVTAYWWNGVASADATPSFYFGFGINPTVKPWGFGAYVKAPANGTAAVSTYANLKIAVWGNDELMKTKPTLTLLLKGPTVGACQSVLKTTVSVPAIGAQNYTVALSSFTLDTACAYASAAAALAAGVNEVHIQVLAANVQYTTIDAAGSGMYANGLNVGPISFSN